MAAIARDTLIDRAFLEKLERLTLRWRRSFPGIVGGHNRSHFPGPGQEFLDHRHFHHGDDLRAVNWRAYLRLEKLFLKMFQVEPRIPVRLLLDCSESMNVGTVNKFLYARRLAAALCYVGLVRLDNIHIHPFREKLEDGFVCSGGRHRFAPTADFLSKLEASGRTNFYDVARQFAGTCGQRGLLIILSDFLDEGGCERPLQFLADLGYEILLVHIWAEEDRLPPWTGELELADAETGVKMELAFDAEASAGYAAAFDAWAARLQALASSKDGRYAGISTALPIEEAVFGPLIQARGVE
jgi:uncharacterized protein (DUF58 family)